MLTQRVFSWTDSEGENEQISIDHDSYAVEPCCPQCGERAEYWEGTYDQTMMGNDIRGFNYYCGSCEISTSMQELDDREDDWYER